MKARAELLRSEKEFTQARDRIAQLRRDLPWESVMTDYVFEGPDGSRTLSALFDQRSQLIVYHFMFAPDWDAGCKSCSFWADSFNGVVVHLRHRDAAFAAVSRAPYAKIETYRRRMGWTFPWYSSSGNDFNYDYGVSFRDADVAAGRVFYNFREIDPDGDADLPGISVFYKRDDGEIWFRRVATKETVSSAGFAGTTNISDRCSERLRYRPAWSFGWERSG